MPHNAATPAMINPMRLRPAKSLIIPMSFCAIVLSLGWLARSFEYDTDEGLNLMKSLLMLRGHRLYSEIWSDQPPLFTYLLAWLFKWTGPGVMVGRMLVLAFSALLLWSLYQTLSILEDQRYALWATLLLAGSTWYALFSFSVMIGLPALSLAMVSIWLMAEFRRRGHSRLPAILLPALAGSAAAMSMQTKLFTAAAMPLLAAVCVAPLGDQMPKLSRRRRYVALAVTAASAALSFALIACVTRIDLQQLTRSHVEASTADISQGDQGLSLVPRAWTLLRRDWHLVVLMLIGLSVGTASGHARTGPGARSRWRVWLPMVWFAVAAVALQIHRPVWKHHGLLLTIPASWAAARGLLWLRDAAWPKSDAYPAPADPTRRRWLVAAGIALSCWLVYAAIRGAVRLFDRQADSGYAMVNILQSHAPMTRWVYADRVMAPFRAGLSVPPALAVVSTKRQRAGELDDRMLLEVLQQYRPEQVIIGRLSYGPAFMQYLESHYRRGYSTAPPVLQTHYLRNDLP
ncbi:ArnT family glycosyltransferase [Fontivita pretiosa]|uniref:ArnT family glycosyltransferase n=1 Tax=Fontivita pretiosa TaxID=2989684 RepID=UPI003D16C9FC